MGLCPASHYLMGPGSAGPLRGRKRDVRARSLFLSLPLSLSHARSLRCGIIAMVGWRAPPPPPPPMCTCRWQIWEGGHRVPGVVSWPAVVRGPARESWATVITSDFLPTVMEVLNVERPPAQRSWAMDGAWAWGWGWWIS
jgi:hypothetical protein